MEQLKRLNEKLGKKVNLVLKQSMFYQFVIGIN
jgi:hypothetical protein